MRTIRTDPETVNTPQHTFLQKNAKTRQAVELTVNLFLRFCKNCTYPANSRKTPQQIFFQHGQFLPEPAKIGKTVRFLLSDRPIYRRRP